MARLCNYQASAFDLERERLYVACTIVCQSLLEMKCLIATSGGPESLPISHALGYHEECVSIQGSSRSESEEI